MIATPPVARGAVHETIEDPSPFEVAVTLVGEPGGIAGVAAFEGAEATLEPMAFFATTVNV